jgi:signal transduction histidine kinase
LDPRLKRVALFLACLLFVVLGTVTTLVLPSTGDGGVQVDSGGVVTSVQTNSDAWTLGIRPGWTLAAQGPGQTAYTDGQSVKIITDDLIKREPAQVVVPPLALLAVAGAAYPIGLRRTGTTLAVAAAALVDGAFVPRLGPVGIVCAGIPVILAAIFVGQIAQIARLPRRLFWRAVSWAVIPVGAAAIAWTVGGITAAVEFAAFGYLAVAWLIVGRWRIANAAIAGGSTSKLGIARSVAIETIPFASLLRRTGAQAERDRLASDLHAEVLPAIASRAEELERRGDSASAEVLRDLAHDVRDLVSARRLPILEDEGLVAAAEWLAESLESRASVRIEIDLDGDTGKRPPLVIERAAYRVVQLALDNVIRHSGASRAVVAIAGSAKTLTLVITDNGRGLEPDEADKAKRRGHLGMSDMRSETEAVGASLFVGKGRGPGGPGNPGNPGAGTLVRFRWPA